MKSSLLVGVGMVIVFAGVGSLALIRPREPQPSPSSSASQGQAQTKTPAAAASQPVPGASGPGFLGVLVAREAVDVSGRSEGRVAEVRVRLGDRVAKNDVLASLDVRSLRDELAITQASLRAARAEVERSTLELAEAREKHARRRRALSAPVEAVSEEELANARYQEQYAGPRLEAARARAAEQEARVALLEKEIEEAQIRAPFAGVVTARYVNPGATVTRGAALVRLISAEDLWVRFAVPEEESAVAALRAGLAVTVTVEDVETELAGQVEKVAPEVDPASRMIVAEARVVLPAGTSRQALSGRVARVRVAAQEPRP
ncbi:MAG TPA: efflux RND transporter periplasmic adaptor subunit [Polyangia bacterium]|jgi:RND family efflux transporter MFP subunit|nr:efflux RND transporter periplasmic adaptor subunit [Polyangia bacterium]